MPRATLSFKLPEEEVEFLAAHSGQGWKHLVLDVLSHLKTQISHGKITDEKAAAFEEVRELIWHSIEDRGLNANE